MNDVYVGSAPAPQRSSGCAWVVGIVVGGMLLLLLALAGFATLGWTAFAEQAQAALQQDPAIAEHIGTIAGMDLDITATGDAPGGDEFVWDLEGDKGKGRVLAQLVTEDDGERLQSGTLTLPDGREIPIGADAGETAPAPDAASPAAEEADARVQPGDPDDGNLKGQVPDKPYESGAPDEPVLDKGGG